MPLAPPVTSATLPSNLSIVAPFRPASDAWLDFPPAVVHSLAARQIV
jgi:hypothetical protein